MLIQGVGGGGCFPILFPFYMKTNMHCKGKRSTQRKGGTIKQSNDYN